MTAETMKSVTQVFEERKALAANGSCKTCQWCRDGYCLIQGNVNSLEFSEAELDAEPYPYGPCDDGHYHTIEDDGTDTDIPHCLAYVSRAIEKVEYGDAHVSRHWAFMRVLSEALHLHHDIEDVKSGKAQARLQVLENQLNALRPQDKVPA